jgi:hypothetical protein
MRHLAASFIAIALAAPALAQDIAEPKTGVKFATHEGDMSLLGVGLRTKTLLKVKVYAVGLYVADSALAGALAAHKGKTTTPAFYKDLVGGDFEKQITMRFVRDVSTDQIRDAFRESLKGAEGAKADLFVGYFSDTKSGQEYVLRWVPGTGLETKAAGLNKPPINDKAFAAAVFGIWLGDKPIQDEIKRDLVARAAELLK